MFKFNIVVFVLACVALTLFSFTNKEHKSVAEEGDCIMVRGDIKSEFDRDGNLKTYNYSSGAHYTQNDLYPVVYWEGEGYTLRAFDGKTFYFCKD